MYYFFQPYRCRYDRNNVAAKVTGYVNVPASELDLQNAVATVGPVSVAIDASSTSFQFYQSEYQRNYKTTCRCANSSWGLTEAEAF